MTQALGCDPSIGSSRSFSAPPTPRRGRVAPTNKQTKQQINSVSRKNSGTSSQTTTKTKTINSKKPCEVGIMTININYKSFAVLFGFRFWSLIA